MYIRLLTSLCFLPVIAYGVTLEVGIEDIQDFDVKLGVGCEIREGDTGITSIVCKSKTSDEYAWNAAMYRAKYRCTSQKFNLSFNKPATLPVENGIYTAQMDIRCIEP